MPALTSSSMRNGQPRRIWAWCLALGFAGLALAASAQPQPADPGPDANGPIVVVPDAPAQPQPVAQPPPDTWDRFWKIEKVSADDDWTRHFRIGAIVGVNISANFSMKGNLPVSGGGAANGIFDDGHVIADPANTADNYTWNWGYDNQSQLNGSTLTMHSTTGYDVNSGAEEKGSAFAGFEMAYGGNLWYWGNARIGWEFGFGLLPITISDHSTMNANVSQDIYTFDTGDINLTGLLPGYQGGPGGPSILNNYDSFGTNLDGTVTGSRTLEVFLYTFRLGPTLYWDLNEDMGLMVGGGPAVGIVSGRLKFNETVNTIDSSRNNQGQIDGTDVVYGGYVNAMLTYHVEKNGDLYLGAQYMPLGRATISGDGREAQLNLAGQVYITAGINWTF
jgi:hypothetical protein